jgi:hypothetical protein
MKQNRDHDMNILESFIDSYIQYTISLCKNQNQTSHQYSDIMCQISVIEGTSIYVELIELKMVTNI